MHKENSPDIPELINTLADYYRLLRDTPDHSGNSIDAARGVLRNVLALQRTITIDSIPGNEQDLIYRLQTQCSYVDALLRPHTDTEIIQRESREAIAQLDYLFSMVSIPYATAIEALCPL